MIANTSATTPSMPGINHNNADGGSHTDVSRQLVNSHLLNSMGSTCLMKLTTITITIARTAATAESTPKYLLTLAFPAMEELYITGPVVYGVHVNSSPPAMTTTGGRDSSESSSASIPRPDSSASASIRATVFSDSTPRSNGSLSMSASSRCASVLHACRGDYRPPKLWKIDQQFRRP